MVKQVGHLQATKELNTMTVELEVERVLDFGVEANERGEAAGFVALANVVLVDANVGVREAGVNVEDGNELKFSG